MGSITVGDLYLPCHYVSDVEERSCVSELIVMQHLFEFYTFALDTAPVIGTALSKPLNRNISLNYIQRSSSLRTANIFRLRYS